MSSDTALVERLETERVDALMAMSRALRAIDAANRDRLAAERAYEQAKERCDAVMARLAQAERNGNDPAPVRGGTG